MRFENHQTIDQILDIACRVGRDHDRALIIHLLGKHLTQSLSRGNIQTVGRLIEQQHGSIARKRKGQVCLLALSHRHTINTLGTIDLETRAAIVKTCLVIIGIERSCNLHKAIKSQLRETELLRHDHQRCIECRTTLRNIDTLNRDCPRIGIEQTRHQIEQRALARTIATQQPDNLSRRNHHRQRIENLRARFKGGVTKF